MTPTTVQLWERIHAAGLATPDECRKWAVEISKSSPESLQDSNRLAAELIRIGKITSFQANVLFGNLPIPLSNGPFRITESMESKLGAHWYKAIDSSRPKRPNCWFYFLTPETLSRPEMRSWPPSLRLAAMQMETAHPSLDKWLFAGIDKTNFVGVCEALQGQSLGELLRIRTLTWSESASMIEQIATGLQKMHDAGIVHGRIDVESIWCVDDGEFVLRRDPVFPPGNPYLASCISVFSDHSSSPWATAAPELTLPNAPLSFQSDLYALGCVWYQSITRSSPYGVGPDATFQTWAKAHFSERYHPLNPAMLPQPLQQCLSHLLAKNVSARFGSSSSLIQAMEYAVDESTEQNVAPVKEVILPPDIALPSKAIESASHAMKPSAPTGKPKFAPSAIPAEKAIEPEAGNHTDFVSAELVVEDVGKRATPEPSAAKVSTAPASAKIASSTNRAVTQPQKQSNPIKPKSKKKKSKKKQKPVWFFPALIGGACLMFVTIVTVLVQNGNQESKSSPTTVVVTEPKPTPTPTNSTTATQVTSGNLEANVQRSPSDSISEYFAVEPDDGLLLWAPPHAGSPHTLELMPAGVEAMVFVSGNLWHQRASAASIGKWWLAIQPELNKHLAGIPLNDDDRISSVAIALLASKKPGVPQAVFRYTYAQPVTIDSVSQHLAGFSMQLFDPKDDKRKGLWSNDAATNATAALMDGMQTEGNAKIQRVVVGPQELIATLPELNGAPAPVRRQLEALLKTTDTRTDLTLLFAPSFLFGDGRELLASEPKLQSALRESIDETMQAVAFTTTIEPRWYLELRMLGSETRDAGKFTAAIKSKVVEIPEAFEKGLTSGSVLHPYWRALGLRYPQMMRALNRYGRFGLEDGQIVTNAYLPTDAMSNIAIASWMALQNPVADAGTSVATSPKPALKPPTKSIDEILESKITIGFDQESLEAALQLIAGELTESVLSGGSITMSINGSAFQKEGITRNQSIRSFKHDGDTLRNILMDVVRRANTVTTVKSPTEQNQKVVWLILDDPDHPGNKKIELTTRTWAIENKATLPKEFVGE